MLAIIILSITAAIVAVPCVGLLMLVDTIRNPPQHVQATHGIVCLGNDVLQSSRTEVRSVLDAV